MALTEHALLSPEYLSEVRALSLLAVGGVEPDRESHDGQTLGIDELREQCLVKIADAWCWVWIIDLANRRVWVQEQRQEARPDEAEVERPAWWYPVTIGERFLVAEPF